MITSEWPSADNPHLVPFVVRQVKFLRNAGIDVDVFAFRGAKKPLNYLRAWSRAHRKLREGRYDLVHAQWAHSAIVALPTRLPLVVTFRGAEGGIIGADGRFTPLSYVLRAIGYCVARRADELVLVSAHMGRILPNRSFNVVPSGLDLSGLPDVSQIEARERLGLPLGKPLVLFVGNPKEARKRFALAEEIVSRLPGHLNAELVLAWGEPHERIPLYMHACDALLFTSAWEGSPNVIKESLACNLPIVSTDVGDVRERLAGVSGCAVHLDGNVEAMTTSLATLLQKRQRIEGRRAVLQLDEALLTERMISIYQRALSNRRRSA
jgi:glycosyltransferase involved in cell wall biosynthesis